MNNFDLILCVIGMALVSAIPRALPMTLLADVKMPVFFLRWLSFVPATILAALVAPDILLVNGKINISLDNVYLIASIPTLIVAIWTKSLFITLAFGMGFVALLRFFGM